jgi:hypothetical protein
MGEQYWPEIQPEAAALADWQPASLGLAHGPDGRGRPVLVEHDGTRTGCGHHACNSHGGAADVGSPAAEV